MSNHSSSKWHWLTIFTFNEVDDALQVEAFLHQNGIEARIRDERRLQRFWFVVKPRGGIHVQIHTESLDESLARIHALPGIKAQLRNVIRCPACDSSRIHYPAMTRKNIVPTLVVQIARLLGLSVHKFYCEDCHNVWVPQSEKLHSGAGTPVKAVK